jgi:hypothetical protein
LTLFLVTLDLHGAAQPPGNLYADIYRDIENHFGQANFCRDFGQFCLVKSDDPVSVVKDRAKRIIDQRSNSFSARDVVVFSLGGVISISRGWHDEELRGFRRFFIQAQ